MDNVSNNRAMMESLMQKLKLCDIPFDAHDKCALHT